MQTIIKAKVIKIGNSQGIRIPRLMLGDFNLGDEVELEAAPGALIMRQVARPRGNWEEKYRQMAQHGDDALLDAESVNASAWDEDEWQW